MGLFDEWSYSPLKVCVASRNRVRRDCIEVGPALLQLNASREQVRYKLKVTPRVGRDPIAHAGPEDLQKSDRINLISDGQEIPAMDPEGLGFYPPPNAVSSRKRERLLNCTCGLREPAGVH